MVDMQVLNVYYSYVCISSNNLIMLFKLNKYKENDLISDVFHHLNACLLLKITWLFQDH